MWCSFSAFCKNAAVPEGKETKTGHDERNSLPVAWLDMVNYIGVASLTLRQCFWPAEIKVGRAFCTLWSTKYNEIFTWVALCTLCSYK